MAESDRPVPDSQPGGSSEGGAVAGGGLDEQVFLADGTPVGEGTRSTSGEEVDDLLELFREEMEADGADPAPARLTEQEVAEEELIRRAEALLGTTDPNELEHLAEIHRAEATDHFERLSRQRDEIDATVPDTAVAEPAPAADADTTDESPAATIADEPGEAIEELAAVIEEEPAGSVGDAAVAFEEEARESGDAVEETAATVDDATSAPTIEAVPEPVAADESAAVSAEAPVVTAEVESVKDAADMDEIDAILESLGSPEETTEVIVLDTIEAAPVENAPAAEETGVEEAAVVAAGESDANAEAPLAGAESGVAELADSAPPVTEAPLAEGSEPELAPADASEELDTGPVPVDAVEDAPPVAVEVETAAVAESEETETGAATSEEPPAEPEAVSAPVAEPEPELTDAEPEAPEPELAGVEDAAPRWQVAAFAALRGLAGPVQLLAVLPRRVFARMGTGAVSGKLGALSAAGARRLATSKGRLAIAAGLTAAVAAYVGFALFDARFSQQMLARRFPDATTAVDLAYFQAVAELERGAFVRAKQRLRTVAASGGDEREADVQFALGEAYFLDAGAPPNYRYARAREYYQAAIAADPDHPRAVDARFRVAETYRAQRLWPEAARAYRLLLARYPRDADPARVQFALAEVLREDGRVDEAAERYERVWNEFPQSPLASAARLRHGDVLFASGRRAAAQQLWRELAHARTAPAVRWEAIARLADLAQAEGDLRGARSWWEVWLRGSPHTARQPAAWLKYAELAQRLGDPDTAAASLDFIVQAYPDRPEGLEAALRRGAMLRQGGENEAARELYADMLVHAPEDVRLLGAMRDAYEAEGNLKRAVEYAERAAAADPGTAAEQLRLAAVYAHADAPGRAMSVYWKMLVRYPLAEETRTAVTELVRLLQEQGYTEEAYRVVTVYGTNAGGAESAAAVHEAKATLLTGMQLWEEVEAELAAALTTDPSDRLRLRLAEAQVRTRNWVGALRTLDDVSLSALDDDAFARHAAARIPALIRVGRAADVPALMAEVQQRLGQAPLGLQGLQAQAYMALGETARARELIAAFDVTLEPGAPPPAALADTYLAWAEHLFDAGIYSRAAEYFARVQGNAYSTHDRAWAAYQVGNCYAQLQDYARAVAAYEAMIAAHPVAPWVPFAREKAQFAQLQADAERGANRT